MIAGANIIIYANHMLRAAYPGMAKVAKSILENGCSSSMEKNMLSIKEILEISGGISSEKSYGRYVSDINSSRTYKVVEKS